MSKREKKTKTVETEINFSHTVVKEDIKTLHFESNGWCEELEKSYYSGDYTPKSLSEYEALKKYAVK